MGNKLSNEDFLKQLNEAGLYTIGQLQTAGLSSVNWDNLTNVPPEFGGDNKFTSLNDTPISIEPNYKLVGNSVGTDLIFVPDPAVADGVGVTSITYKSTLGLVDTYTILYTDASTSTFNVTNGAVGDQGIQGVIGVTGNTGAAGFNGLSLVTVDAGVTTITDALFLTAAGRAAVQYDSYLNTNAGDKILWIREATAWISSGSIIGDTGSIGAAIYTYMAYASDNIGTGFTYTPSDLLLYRAEVTSISGTAPIDETAFETLMTAQGRIWVKYIGDDGAAGLDGTNGTNGTNGIDGYSITIEDAALSDTVGNDGDSYILKTNWDTYEKITGNWAKVGNIKGLTGDPGTNGADGADGDIYLTTSTTPIDLSTYNVGDTINITTVDSGLAYSVNQLLVVSSSSTLYFIGKVITYGTNSLSVKLTYKVGLTSSSAWTINLSGLAESIYDAGWYTITATTGTGTLASRTFTGPTGWTIGAANTVSNTDLPGTSEDDLRIKHDTGLAVMESIVYVQESTYNTKATGTVAYGTMYEDQNNTTIQLSSFCTQVKELIIYVKLQ
jgi:hypothetical protein